VVFVDICSSSSIVDNLIVNRKEQLYRALLVTLKRFLQESELCASEDSEIYKFIGDGRVLLFPTDVPATKLVAYVAANHFINQGDEHTGSSATAPASQRQRRVRWKPRGRNNARGEHAKASCDVTRLFLRVRVAQVTLVQRCTRPFQSFFS